MTQKLDPIEKELRANVRRGARLLDKTVPGWFEKLYGAMKMGRFEMAEPQRCVVGTLELAKWEYDSFSPNKIDYTHFEIRLNGVLLCDWHETEQYGFYADEDSLEQRLLDYGEFLPFDVFSKLEELWADEVDKRLEK